MSSSGSRAKEKMTFLIDHILQPDFGSACGSSSSQTLMIEEATKNSKNTQLSNTTEPDAGHMVMGHLRSKSYTTETKDDIFITAAAAGSSTRSQMKFTKGEKTEKYSTERTSKTEIKTESSTTTLPAWIFCTRYSDRPSCTGKKETKLFHAKLGSSFVTRIYRAA